MSMEKLDELLWKHGAIRSTPRAYGNSECVFIEYRDCVHFTGFVILHFLQGCYKDLFGLDLDPIKIMSTEELLLWYCNRKNRNFLLDLWSSEEVPPYKQLDDFLEDQYTSKELYSVSIDNNLTPLLQNLQSTKFAKRIVFYAETVIPEMVEDLHSKFGPEIEVVSGNLEEVLKGIPQDSTYIFSDMEKILTLEAVGKLDFSAVMVPTNFRYNYTEDGKFIVNIDYLQESHPFKFATIDLCGI